MRRPPPLLESGRRPYYRGLPQVLRPHHFIWCGRQGIFGEEKPKRKYIPKDTKLRVVERQNDKCAICGKRLKIGSYHIDHKRAVALGGSDSIRNLQALCPSCHDRKSKEDARKMARKKRKEREESWW